MANAFTNAIIGNLSRTKFQLVICCMQQKTSWNFLKLVTMLIQSIFKEYGVQYSNKMEESLGYIWHEKMQQASTHDFEIPQQQTLGMHMTVPNLPMAILDASRGSFPSPSSCLQVGHQFCTLVLQVKHSVCPLWHCKNIKVAVSYFEPSRELRRT